ncbi:restriction endonuclease subunit S [Ligilactobacillus salivarius]
MKNSSLSVDTEKLRKKILDLAMRGKLVPQDSQDEPASTLLEKIKEEKAQLIKEKKIKKSKPLPEITEEEKPFEIPESWEWVRLGDVLQSIFAGGDKPKEFSEVKTDKYAIPVIANGRKSKGVVGYTNSAKVYGEALTISARGTIGYSVVRKDPFYPIVRLICIQDTILNLDFISVAIKDLVIEGTGSSIPQLTVPKLKTILIPLPPLAEQKRIVAKVEECMQAIKTIEDSSKEYEKLENQLDKKVLDLAMCGKLVPQDSQDEPASTLLEKIKEEKAQLIKEKKIKKSKPLPEITDEEKPFKIPESWEWVRLGEVTNIVMGQAPKGTLVEENGKGFEFHQGKTHFTDYIIGSSDKTVSLDNRVIEPRSIVMSVRAPVGDVNIVDRKIYIGRGLSGIKSVMSDYKYLFYFLSTQKENLNTQATGSTFKAINGNIVKSIIVPLPPLAEQKRIVAKIEEIKQYLEI